MAGFIVRETVVANKDLVIELYGRDVYEACLSAGPDVTFLGLLSEMGIIG